jgi:hypothetical protein
MAWDVPCVGTHDITWYIYIVIIGVTQCPPSTEPWLSDKDVGLVGIILPNLDGQGVGFLHHTITGRHRSTGRMIYLAVIASMHFYRTLMGKE